ncbi:MAG: hypothetical protein IH947_03800 [Bacteroidetes bacterium]|nr:hypothetical protein [Bacteroidota bacterium]
MMKLMKYVAAVCMLSMVSTGVFAQDETEITDDQLYRYAIMQEVINLMKKDISVEVNKIIKAQEGMTGKRYKELAATKDDEAKLQAIDAKDWEIRFLKQIDDFKSKRIASIKTVNSELATKMVGDRGKDYKRIKDQLKSDESFKSRYDSIVASVSAAKVKAD